MHRRRHHPGEEVHRAPCRPTATPGTSAGRFSSAANTEAERAFAHGYLSHLAADVYSHNHFVPTQLVVSFRAHTLRHVYWEARFDNMQDPEYRDIVRDLRKRRFPACDALVERVVARTIFSFKTNKRIFDSVLAFHDWDNWHRFMENVSTRSKFRLPSTWSTTTTPPARPTSSMSCGAAGTPTVRKRIRAAWSLSPPPNDCADP